MNVVQNHIYEFGGFRLDTAKHLLLKGSDEIVPLMPKAFDTLHYLVLHHGKVVEKDELMREIWADTIVEENNLTQNISILRRIFGEKPGEHRFIVTVPGRGYKFVAEVREGAVPIVSADRSNAKEIYLAIDANETRSDADRQRTKADDHLARDAKPAERNKRPTRYWLIAVFVIAIIGASFIAFYSWQANKRSPARSIKSVAVLPFINASQDLNAEYLSDGVTESVINNLSQLTGLRVLSRNSAFRFKNDQSDTRNIASQLDVEALVTGDIKQIGDRFVINVRLIDASNDSQIWGNQYVKSSGDILVAQNEIAQAVAQNLRIRLTATDNQRLGKNYTENAEAWQLYQKGRYFVFKLTPQDSQKGISYFQQAIDIDPNYALAYAGLAEAYLSLALGGEGLPTEFLPRSKAAANKAIEIDETLSEGHTALGFTLFWSDWDWGGAEDQFKRALELNQNSASAHMFYAHLLSNTGRHAESLTEIEFAKKLDPLFPVINALEGQFLLHAGRTDEALVQLRKAIELAPNFWMPHLFASSAYTEKRMYTEAIAEAGRARELSAVQTTTIAVGGFALAKSGRRNEAQAALDELLKLSTERFVPPYHIALIYWGLGQRKEALEWLEKGFEQRDAKMAFLKVDPKWNNLRSEPRFVELMRKMNLSE
jgi:TolB-like protein/DNA-binding winged helix-turn-helix (wHTH) protein/Flp pilus assembly protein TadD